MLPHAFTPLPWLLAGVGGSLGRPGGWGGGYGGWGGRPHYGGWGRKLMGSNTAQQRYGPSLYGGYGPYGGFTAGRSSANAFATASSNSLGGNPYFPGGSSSSAYAGACADSQSFGRKLRKLLGADSVKCGGGYGCGGGGGYYSPVRPCAAGWGARFGGCGGGYGGYGGGYSSSSASARAEASSNSIGGLGPFIGGSGSAASADAVASSNSFNGRK